MQDGGLLVVSVVVWWKFRDPAGTSVVLERQFLRTASYFAFSCDDYYQANYLNENYYQANCYQANYLGSGMTV